MSLLESLALLIVALGYKVGTDIATNIENRIINAAIDAVNQKQQPSLTTLGLYMSDLQKKQDEMMALHIREIKRYYQDGIAALVYANTASDKKQKKKHIYKAIDDFTSASHVEVGEAQIEAALFVGACFYALRRIDHKTSIALENGAYERAFQLAHAYRSSDGKPPLDLIEKLLQLQYLREKYGTFEDYRKQFEPKLIDTQKPFYARKLLEASKLPESPKVVNAPASFDLSKYLQSHPRGLSREQRRLLFVFGGDTSRLKACMKCGGPFNPLGHLQFGQTTVPPSQRYCPKCLREAGM